jgi:hypothetical protein
MTPRQVSTLLFAVLLLLAVSNTLASDDEAKAFDPIWREIGHYLGVLVAGAIAAFSAGTAW